MMASFRADAQGQLRAAGSRATASVIAACAVCALRTSVRTIISTVTESCSGCQQS
jgi:hypothetical protein